MIPEATSSGMGNLNYLICMLNLIKVPKGWCILVPTVLNFIGQRSIWNIWLITTCSKSSMLCLAYIEWMWPCFSCNFFFIVCSSQAKVCQEGEAFSNISIISIQQCYCGNRGSNQGIQCVTRLQGPSVNPLSRHESVP